MGEFTDVAYARWHVTENDITGGWAIVNMETEKLSAVWGYGTVQVLFETPHKNLAQYVVSLHNARRDW